MNASLQEFSRARDPDVQAVLIRDGAGFHRGGKLRVPGNVRLVELPPSSPQLNPIENLWHYLRSHDWSNRWYEDHEALMSAAGASVAAAFEGGEGISLPILQNKTSSVPCDGPHCAARPSPQPKRSARRSHDSCWCD